MKQSRLSRAMLAAVLLAAAPTTLQAQNAVALYQRNGQVIHYLFTSTPRVSYAGDCLLMSDSTGTVQYAMRGIRKMTFEQIDPNGIESVADDGAARGLVFSFRLGQIAVSGAEPGAKATLFDLDGKQLSVQTADTQGRCILSTAALPKGVYVIQIGKTSYKIVK